MNIPPVETQNLSQQKRRKRIMRSILAISLLIGGYFLLLWLLPMLVDKQSLRTEIRTWLEQRLEYRASVTLGDVDLALRGQGRGDLYLKDLDIESPNPEFERPCLKIGLIRMSCFMPALLLHTQLEPVAQIRSGTLRVERNAMGQLNLASFTDPVDTPQAKTNFPFLRDDIQNISLQLMRCNLLWIDRQRRQEATLQIEGEMRLDIQQRMLVGAFSPTEVAYAYRTDDGIKRSSFVLEVQRLELAMGSAPGEAPVRCMLGAMKVKDIPLQAFTLLHVPIPAVNEQATASGRLEYAYPRFFFDGTVEGAQFPGLSLPPSITLSLRPLTGEDGLLVPDARMLEVRAEDKPILLAEIAPDTADGKLRLWCKISHFDFDAYLRAAPATRAWFGTILQDMAGITLEFDRLQIGGIEVQKASCLLAQDPSGQESLSMEGLVPGGKIALVAKGKSLLDGGEPTQCRIHYKFDDMARAWQTMQHAWRIPLQIPIRAGSGEAFLDLEKTGGTTGWRLRVACDDVRIQTLTGGPVVRELANLQQSLIAVENLRRKSHIPPLPILTAREHESETLLFKSLLLTCLLDKQEGVHELLAVGQLSEGGELTFNSAPMGEGPFTLEGFLTKLDTSQLQAPGVSPEILKAAQAVMHKRGLHFRAILNGSDWRVEPQYIQEIFRNWNEQKANAHE